jgi:hypothetical protein
MIIDAVDYERGLVKWNPASDVVLRTATSDADDSSQAQWSEPLTDPNGSIVQSPRRRMVQLRADSGTPTPATSPAPIRWERIDESGCIATTLWDPDANGGDFVKLAHIPTYGVFHRLVIAADRGFVWDADKVIRVSDAVVRLHSGALTGEQVTSFDCVEVATGGLSISGGGGGTATAEGKFVEIIAPGSTPFDAKLLAFALLGLVSVVFGDCVVGSIVFSEPFEALPGRPQESAYSIPVEVRVPQAAEDAGLRAIDGALHGLLESTPVASATRLALRWLEKGIRSGNATDQLISYFVGIEAVLNAYTAAAGGVPAVVEHQRTHAPELRCLLRGKLDREARDKVFRSLGYASAREKFAFYRAQRGLDEGFDAVFRNVAQQRNSLFHGGVIDETTLDAGGAGRLLVSMLKAELGIASETPRDLQPVLPTMVTRFSFEAYGVRRRG